MEPDSEKEYWIGYWDGFKKAQFVICEKVRKEAQGVVTLVAGIWIIVGLMIAGWYGSKQSGIWMLFGIGILAALVGFIYMGVTITKACYVAEQEVRNKLRE